MTIPSECVLLRVNGTKSTISYSQMGWARYSGVSTRLALTTEYALETYIIWDI